MHSVLIFTLLVGISCSVHFRCSVMSDSLLPHGLQHARLSCPSPTPRAYSNSCISCWWYHHPTISSSVVPFSRLQSFPTSGSFPMSQFFALGGQSIGDSASASVLPMNTQDWFPWGSTCLISLQSNADVMSDYPKTLAPIFFFHICPTLCILKQDIICKHMSLWYKHTSIYITTNWHVDCFYIFAIRNNALIKNILFFLKLSSTGF